MESVFIIMIWLLGIIMIAIGWYVPNAGGFVWLGGLTLVFGAALAFMRREAG